MTEIINHLSPSDELESFMLVAYPGGGKTSQGLTLPRPCLFIFFDPNGPASVRGFDVDSVSFLPKDAGYMPVRPEAKNADASRARSKKRNLPDIPDRFQDWFNNAQDKGELDQYRSIVVDSTSWLEAAMTEMVLYDAGRWGMTMDGGNYETLRSNIIKLLYPIASRNAYILICTHIKDKTNRAGDILGRSLALVGQARHAVPSLVSNVLWLDYERGKGTSYDKGARYVAITRPDETIEVVRQVGKHHTLPYKIDMTIKDWDHPENYGLGRLIRAIESGEYPYQADGSIKE